MREKSRHLLHSGYYCWVSSFWVAADMRSKLVSFLSHWRQAKRLWQTSHCSSQLSISGSLAPIGVLIKFLHLPMYYYCPRLWLWFLTRSGNCLVHAQFLWSISIQRHRFLISVNRTIRFDTTYIWFWNSWWLDNFVFAWAQGHRCPFNRLISRCRIVRDTS